MGLPKWKVVSQTPILSFRQGKSDSFNVWTYLFLSILPLGNQSMYISALKVQDQTIRMVFRMIHGARIPYYQGSGWALGKGEWSCFLAVVFLGSSKWHHSWGGNRILRKGEFWYFIQPGYRVKNPRKSQDSLRWVDLIPSQGNFLWPPFWWTKTHLWPAPLLPCIQHRNQCFVNKFLGQTTSRVTYNTIYLSKKKWYFNQFPWILPSFCHFLHHVSPFGMVTEYQKKTTSMAAAWCNASSAEMTFRIPYGKKDEKR